MTAVVPLRGLEPRRIPPHNYEAEQALLAALLSHNAVFPAVVGAVSPEDFADPVHGRIFAAACRLIAEGRTANALTLGNHFDADGALEEVGGAAYLARLQNSVVTLVGVEDYAATIRDLANRRRAIERLERGLDELYTVDFDRTGADVAADISADLTAAVVTGRDDFETIADVAERVVESLGKDLPCCPTGLASLDAVLEGGLYAERLYGFAARYKVGKTMLLATIAQNLNLDGNRALYMCLEMGSDQITQRILGRMMGVNALAFMKPGWRDSPDFIAAAGRAAVDMRNHNNLLFEQRRASLEEVRQSIARAALRHGVKGVIIDYLQLITGQQRGQTTAAFLDDVTRTLTDLTKRYGIWIVIAAQLNQDGNVRQGESLLMDCDVSFKLHKVESIGAPDRGWLQCIAHRYGEKRDVGSELNPAFEIETRAGPFFVDIGDRAPAEAPLIEG